MLHQVKESFVSGYQALPSAASVKTAAEPFLAQALSDAARGISWLGAFSAEKIYETLPSTETLKNEWASLKEDPRKILPLARKIWSATPWWGHLAAAYLMPTKTIWKGLAFANAAYRSYADLPESVKKTIHESAQELRKKNPKFESAIQLAGDLSHPILIYFF